jgi:hypothetical protein
MNHALVVCHWRGLMAVNVDSALMEYACASWGATLAWVAKSAPRTLGVQFSNLDRVLEIHPHHTVVSLVPGRGIPTLPEFEHPAQAVYIIGADDAGYDPPSGSVQLAIDTPTGPERPLYSWQVATVLLYDRWLKEQ